MVIDEDQGLSGRTADNRAGFQRLMAEVGLNHVGIVLGLELSRLSRSNKDWHQLVDVCGIFNTLLGDQDGVYDSSDGNDRLTARDEGRDERIRIGDTSQSLVAGHSQQGGAGRVISCRARRVLQAIVRGDRCRIPMSKRGP